MKKVVIAVGAIYLVLNAGETVQKVIQFDVHGDSDYITCRRSGVIPGQFASNEEEELQRLSEAASMIMDSGKHVFHAKDLSYDETISALESLGFSNKAAQSLVSRALNSAGVGEADPNAAGAIAEGPGNPDPNAAGAIAEGPGNPDPNTAGAIAEGPGNPDPNAGAGDESSSTSL